MKTKVAETQATKHKPPKDKQHKVKTPQTPRAADQETGTVTTAATTETQIELEVHEHSSQTPISAVGTTANNIHTTDNTFSRTHHIETST